MYSKTSLGRPKSVRSSRGRRSSLTSVKTKLQLGAGMNPHSLTLLASKQQAQSKSLEDDLSKVGLKSRRDSLKQAWAPSPKHSLASRSIHAPGHPSEPSNPLPPLALRESRPPSTRSRPASTASSRPTSRLFKAKDGSAYLMIDNELKSDFGRAEDRIYLQDLEKLRQKFEEADIDGNGTLDVEEFLSVFDKLFGLHGKGEEEILKFFNKIDYNCDNTIDWDEFCTYMYLEYQERDLANNRQKLVKFQCPAQTTPTNPHNDALCRIAHLPDGSLVTCSVDGVLCFWSNSLVPKRVRKPEPGHIGKPKWVTDMALCMPQSKILLTTGDREVQFYEMMNFEPYCQLRRLESVPLKIAYWYNPNQHSECIILIGDREGTLTVITAKNIHEAFKYWKQGQKSEEGMPTYSVESLSTEEVLGTSVYRWKLHSNWVTEVHYFPTLRSFASCSSDSTASLVLGSPTGSTPIEALLQTTSSQLASASAGGGLRPGSAHSGVERGRPKSALPARTRLRGDQRVFRVGKGVSTVAFCPKNNALVTGSTDQIIRIWNPFINTKPIAHLFGQGAPIFAVKVDSEEDRIFSIGNDNTVKVWHTLDHVCLCSVVQTTHKILNTVQTFHFNPISQLLAVGTDQLSLLKLMVPKKGQNKVTQSHSHPISAVKFSRCFDQLVTGCEGAIVKAWDIFTGQKMFEFSCDLGKDVGVSALDVDKAGKRVVTGGQNGQIKVWNYNNGQCVRILNKGNRSEVTDIKFITINNNRFIISVGWDRRISLFPDVPAKHSQLHQHVAPVTAWSEASDHAHSEDILCVAFGSPHLMATASFDGEVIVWSVISCHALHRLKATPPSVKTSGSNAVYKLLFLDSRVRSRTAATLVASGPAGYVHFWNLYSPSLPMGRFRASSEAVTALSGDTSDTVLFTAESRGHICVWNISDYCVSSRPARPPTRVALWRAHTDSITCMELIEGRNLLASAAADGSVRLWTLDSHYIGSFGQSQVWRLGDPTSYQYPLAPEDIRLNPDLPTLVDHKKETKSLELLLDSCDEGIQEGWSKGGVVSEEVVGGGQSDLTTDSEEMSCQEEDDTLLQSHISLGVPLGQGAAGKRLRHLWAQSAAERRPGHSPNGVYTKLPYQSLNEEEEEHIRRFSTTFTRHQFT